MYVVSSNGVTWYDGIDRADLQNIRMHPISNDLMNYTLSLGAIDCSARGHVVFDAKNMNG